MASLLRHVWASETRTSIHARGFKTSKTSLLYRMMSMQPACSSRRHLPTAPTKPESAGFVGRGGTAGGWRCCSCGSGASGGTSSLSWRRPPHIAPGRGYDLTQTLIICPVMFRMMLEPLVSEVKRVEGMLRLCFGNVSACFADILVAVFRKIRNINNLFVRTCDSNGDTGRAHVSLL